MISPSSLEFPVPFLPPSPPKLGLVAFLGALLAIDSKLCYFTTSNGSPSFSALLFFLNDSSPPRIELRMLSIESLPFSSSLSREPDDYLPCALLCLLFDLCLPLSLDLLPPDFLLYPFFFADKSISLRALASCYSVSSLLDIWSLNYCVCSWLRLYLLARRLISFSIFLEAEESSSRASKLALLVLSSFTDWDRDGCMLYWLSYLIPICTFESNWVTFGLLPWLELCSYNYSAGSTLVWA